MGIFDKMTHAITESIKMNDKIIVLSERVKELAEDVKDINGRVIRLETFIEIAEKQRHLRYNESAHV